MISLIHSRGEYPADGATNPFTSDDPLCIVEVGGGNGSCAKGIMDFLRDRHPKLYEVTRYTIIDVSVPFHKRQSEVLAEHADKVTLVNKSVFAYETRPDLRFAFLAPA
jgi:SAM-dependent MidA family methyltransferase